MKMIVILLTLIGPSVAYADSCRVLQADSGRLAHKMALLSDRLVESDELSIELEGIIFEANELGMDNTSLYDRYLNVQLSRHKLEKSFIDLENLSFMTRIMRVKKCGLHVPYSKKRRNKNV